jgi:beta-lactamase regulating signal transducer with metallopeptidase domain
MSYGLIFLIALAACLLTATPFISKPILNRAVAKKQKTLQRELTQEEFKALRINSIWVAAGLCFLILLVCIIAFLCLLLYVFSSAYNNR